MTLVLWKIFLTHVFEFYDTAARDNGARFGKILSAVLDVFPTIMTTRRDLHFLSSDLPTFHISLSLSLSRFILSLSNFRIKNKEYRKII